MFASDQPPCDAAPATSTSVSGTPSPGPTVSQEFCYPSADPGFPALDLDHILGAHAQLLSRIKVCYGAPREVFEQDVMAVVRRYAAFVHLLPATPANYFSEPGGLLRLGLETAFYALQGTDAHIFSGRAPIAVRRHLEPRWRLATFIAGLCAELHRAVGQVVVTDHGGSEWPAYLLGLLPWLTDNGAQRYHLKWLPGAPACPGYALFALPHIVPAGTLERLAQGNKAVVPHLMASLSRMPLAREHNILDELVQRSAALVIDRFLQASADRFGKPILGAHLERHLVDAMRRLVGTHAAWAPNAERSRIWLGSDGLFVVWPNAAADISKLLEADQLPSVPKSSATMLEVLLGAGIVQAQPDGKPLFTIRPPGARVTMEAVKLTDPAIVLVGLEHGPQPLAETLQVVPAQTGDAPVASPSPLKPTPAAPQPPEAVAGGSGAPGPRHPEEQDRRTGATAAPRTAVEGAQQLELQISPMEPAVVHRCAVAPAAPEPEGRYRGPTRIALEAPMRLAPRLRAVLVEILEASNAADGTCRVQPTVDGLFIALAEFERRHIEPSRALRALSDARMIAKGAAPGSGTSTVRLAGQVHLGLTILPPFLSGWQTPDPA